MFLINQINNEAIKSSTDIKKETIRNVNAVERFFNSIDWDQIVTILIEKIVYVSLLCLLFFFIQKIGQFVIHRAYQQYDRNKGTNESRLRTIHTLTTNAFNYLIFFLFTYSILTVVGVPVGSLLAGAGIAGVAIGLGAQGFINDLITGFLVISEQQMDVGDRVNLTPLRIIGTVKAIGLRTTQIKSDDGTIHFVPNRNISIISNLSRANMQIQIDVRINPEEGYPQIVSVIRRINDRLKEEYNEIIQTDPALFGLIDLGNSNFAIRITVYVLNGQQSEMKEKFLSYYVSELSVAGFTIPNTPIH